MVLWVGSTLTAWADGAGELEPFDITGHFQATHRGDLGRVAVIDFVGNYDRVLKSGLDNLEARAIVAREFFRTHPDTYDFLVVFSTFEYDSGEAVAMHFGVQNQVQGLGIAPFDVSDLFGSDLHLLGYIDMGALSRHETDPLAPAFEDTLAILGHEVMHQWSGRARFVDAGGKISTALLGKDGAHWSDLLDTRASVLYGHQWRDNQDGSFTSEAVQRFFSPLDLYLAGFYEASEVPPFLLIDNPDHPADVLPKPGITVQGRATTVTIEDVIAAEGPRIPPAEQAQKAFRFAFILLTYPGQVVEPVSLTGIERVSTKFAERFAVWTGGRAIVHVEQSAPTIATVGAPTVIETAGVTREHPAALSVGLQDGLAWLQARQQTDGSWWDKPATALRDTAAVVEALLPLAGDFMGREKAMQWLLNQALPNADYQARQIRVLGEVQAHLEPEVRAAHRGAFHTLTHGQLGQLIHRQRDDGGWSLAARYASDPLDTALVLMASSAIGYIERLRFGGPRILSGALQYLADAQHLDGGWGAATDGSSRLHVTAHVLMALRAYAPEHPGIAAGLHWLAGQQHDDGGFGDGSGTIHETAQALRTLIAFKTIEPIRGPEAVHYLLKRQQVSGSWASSIYATALAVDALRRFHLPNWQLAPELHIDPASPVDGDRVTLTTTVRNQGAADTPEGMLRLYDGVPEADALAIAEDLIIPPLAPGASTTLSVVWETTGATGTHTLVAVVDPEQELTEVNEQDNRSTQVVEVAPVPDGVELSVIALQAIPAHPVALPTPLGVSAVVRNTGALDAEHVRVQLWAGTVEDGQPVAESLHRIANRQSVVVNFTYALNEPGTTVLTVVVDAANAFAEINEANNTAAVTVETEASVDLHVSASDIEIAPMPGVAGRDMTFTVRLHNAGTQFSPPAQVDYELTDGQETIDLDSQSIGIEAGGSLERTLTWRADRVGDWTLIVHLDPNDVVSEAEEQNNIASLPFQVGEVDGPNLVVDFREMIFAPNPGRERQALTLSVPVHNTGSHDVQDVTVVLYQGDPDQDGQQIGDPQVLDRLSAKSSVPVSFTWPQVPHETDPLLVVRVDPDDAIAEFSETDNTAFQVLKILSRPDLALEAGDIQLTPGFPAGGQTVHLRAQVANLGEQGAADVVVRLLDRHADGEVQVGEDQRIAVAGRDVATAEFAWTLGEAEAVHTLVVQVDPEDRIAESSEHNNTAQKRMAVQNRDFFVSYPYFSPNGDGVQDDTIFFFRWSSSQTTPAGIAVVVVDETGAIVREFDASAWQHSEHGHVDWDGLDRFERVVRDGAYRFELRRNTGEILGDARVVVDNNRLPLSDAVGTPFGALTNWTCELGDVDDVVFTDGGETPVILAGASATLPKGIYRGRHLEPLVQVGDDEWIESMQVASDGSIMAYMLAQDNEPKQLMVRYEHTANRHPLSLDEDEPLEVLAISIATGDVIVRVREKGGERRERVLAIPLNGTVPRVLYQVTDSYEQIEFHELSANRRQLFVGTNSAVQLIDLISGATQSLYEDSAHLSIVRDVQWSPNGQKIAVKLFREDRDGIGEYQILIFDHEGHAIGEVQPEWTGDSRLCIYLLSGNMSWSPESHALAFDLVQIGIDECQSGGGFQAGLYVVDVDPNIGDIRLIDELDESFRNYYAGDHRNQLGWFRDEDVLFYGFHSDEINAMPLQENLPYVTIVEEDTTFGATVKEIELSPTGRELFYRDSRASRNPESVCYQLASTDLWSYKSVLNLTADLYATRVGPGGGVQLHGTASDLNFGHYQLAYATEAAPEVWLPIQPAVSTPVIDNTFATWLPPAPGTYRIRLTTTDLAGNQRRQIVQVNSQHTVSITDLRRTPALFSPNGDGVLDDVRIRYRVLEPVHLTFDIYNDADERVRTIVRDHKTTGVEQTLVWDGRDDQGLVLPDGPYRIAVQHVSLPVTLDATPPAVELLIQAPYQSPSPDGITPKTAVEPSLIWSVNELHLLKIAIEKAPIGRSDQWQTFIEPAPIGDGQQVHWPLRLSDVEPAQFRLVAEDRAGNRTEARRTTVPELVLYRFGDHQRNAQVETCAVDFGIDSAGYTSCVYGQGGYYEPLKRVRSFEVASTFIPVAAPQVRFAIVENISEPLQQLSVQYAPVSAAEPLEESAVAWREESLSTFLDREIVPNEFAEPPNRMLEAVWALPSLPSQQTYVARLKGTDQYGQVYVSNPVMFQAQLRLLIKGRIQDSSKQEIEQYQLPLTPTRLGNTGFWGLNVSGQALREARFVLRSEPFLEGGYDPRYPTERVVDRIENPLSTALVFEADVAPCMGYVGYIIATTVSGVTIKSSNLLLATPCLDLQIASEPQISPVCNGPWQQHIDIHLAPLSFSGTPLKLLTLARTDATGREDIFFKVNRPRSANLPTDSNTEVVYPYTFTYDTSALPEGTMLIKGTLIDIYDNVVTQEYSIIVDHTSSQVTWIYPEEDGRVCGIPVEGKDGRARHIVPLEGGIGDQYPLHYLVKANGVTIHDIPNEDSFEFLGDQRQIDSYLPPELQSLIGDPLALLNNEHGNVTIRLEALDHGGFRSCVERTFQSDVEATIDVPKGTHQLFSPNADGVMDEVEISVAVEEAGTLDVHIRAAVTLPNGSWRAEGPVLRYASVGQTLASGLHAVTWNGLDDSGNTVGDGHYAVVILFTDTCGNQSRRDVFVEVDRTPPDIAIHYPRPGDPLTTRVEIQGRVQDAHLETYVVELRAGEEGDTAATLTTGTQAVEDGVLALWNTFGLSGPYRIRLVARDRVGNASTVESLVTVADRVTLVRDVTVAPALFSPNGDSKREQTSFRIDVAEAVLLSLQILDTDHRSRRTLAVEQRIEQGAFHVPWDGTDEAGKLVSDGTYIGLLKAVLVDNAAVTQEERVSVTVDATPPQLAVTRPTEGVVTASGFIQGRIVDAHLQRYTVSLTGPSSEPATTVLSQGATNAVEANLGALQGLQEGAYTLTIEAGDQGEIKRVQRYPLVVDNTPPIVELIAPETGEMLGIKHRPVAILGHIREAHFRQYHLRVGKGADPGVWTDLMHATSPPTSDRIGSWDIASQPDGRYTLLITVEDRAGLITEKRVSVTLDQTPPKVTLSTPDDEAYLSTGLTLMGTVADAHLVSYRIEIAPVSAPEQWSSIAAGTTPVENGALGEWQALPPDGVYQLRLLAMDAADNMAQVLRRVTIDTHPPVAPATLTGRVTDDQIELSWPASVSADVMGYVVYRDGQLLTTAPVPDLTYVDRTVTEGHYTYTIVAVDQAGLRSPDSPVVDLAVDVTPPLARITAPIDGAAVRGAVEIRGTAYSQDDFKVYRVLIGEGTPAATLQLLRHSPVPTQAHTLANWSTLGLREGSTYRIVLETEDINGNIGTEHVTADTRRSLLNLIPLPTGQPLVFVKAVPTGLCWKRKTSTAISAPNTSR